MRDKDIKFIQFECRCGCSIGRLEICDAPDIQRIYWLNIYCCDKVKRRDSFFELTKEQANKFIDGIVNKNEYIFPIDKGNIYMKKIGDDYTVYYKRKRKVMWSIIFDDDVVREEVIPSIQKNFGGVQI